MTCQNHSSERRGRKSGHFHYLQSFQYSRHFVGVHVDGWSSENMDEDEIDTEERTLLKDVDLGEGVDIVRSQTMATGVQV